MNILFARMILKFGFKKVKIYLYNILYFYDINEERSTIYAWDDMSNRS